MVPDSAVSGSIAVGVLRYPVLQSLNASLLGAVRATKHDTGMAFNAVAYNPAPAVTACWSQCVNRAFKAVERMFAAGYRNFKRLVVLIAANFTGTHGIRLLGVTDLC
jgi:hypothetical protein